MLDIYNPFSLNILEWVQLFLCAIGIGMAKTGLGGIGLLIVPVMAGLFGAKASTGIVLVLLIIADLFGVAYYHQHAEIKNIFRLAPSAIFGIFIGVIAGDIFDEENFKFILSATVLLGAFLLVFQKTEKNSEKTSKFFTIFVGLLGGFSTMVGNAAGPIMTIYFLSMGFKKNKFIGTAAWFFLLVNLFKVPFQVFIWRTINIEVLIFDLCLFPLIYIGAIAGVWIVKKIPDKPYRIFLIISVFLSTIRLFFI